MSLKEHQSCSCFRLGGTDDVIVELCSITWANLVQTVDEMQRVIMGAKISSNGTHPYYQFAYIIKCLFVAVRLSLAESHISPAIVMEVGNVTLPVSATMADTERDPCLEWTTPALKTSEGCSLSYCCSKRVNFDNYLDSVWDKCTVLPHWPLGDVRCGNRFESVMISEHILRVRFLSTACEIALRWMLSL